MSKSNNLFPVISLAALLAVVAAGCGGAAGRVGEDDDGTTHSSQGGSLTGGGNTTTTGGGTPIGEDSDPEFEPNLTTTSYITGDNGTKPSYTSASVLTNSLLKVRVTAGEGDHNSLPSGVYTNFSATYGCVKYTVTVGSVTKTTAALAVAGGNSHCQGAPGSQILDFSGALTPGTGSVKIKVTKGRYDYYCSMFEAGIISQCMASYQAFAWCNTNYCSAGLYPMYQNHTATFTLDVQTNSSN